MPGALRLDQSITSFWSNWPYRFLSDETPATSHRWALLIYRSSRLSCAAKPFGLAWTRTPKDDAWKQAHLAMVEGVGLRVLRGCGANITP